VPCSILILTYNDSIAACIESIAWRNDVHVLDSGSTGNTTAIAPAFPSRLDRRAGRHNYAMMRAAYEIMIDTKITANGV
jgi:hypothetical protein